MTKWLDPKYGTIDRSMSQVDGDPSVLLLPYYDAIGVPGYQIDLGYGSGDRVVVDNEQFVDTMLAEAGLRELLRTRHDSHSWSVVYVGDGDYAWVQWSDAEGKLRLITFQLVTDNKALFEALSKALETKLIKVDSSKGQIYMLSHNQDGYALTYFGQVGSPLIRDNYSDKVAKAYDHIVADLNIDAPCGRLVIFAGPPGCGKTWMLRGMFCEVPKAHFILVPPSLIEMLGDPALLPDLKANFSEFKGPAVFVLEDADACLLPRMNDNMVAVQNVLNATDGIMGAVLDIRIVATTNATSMEIDPALKRPGRLCTSVEVGTLPSDQAERVFTRLTKMAQPSGASFRKDATLAEVYAQAYKLNKMG